MMRVALLAILLGGCATTAALVRPHNVSVPILALALVADAGTTAVLTASPQFADLTTGLVIATTVAATGIDLGVSCLLGGCSAFRP